MQEGLAIRRAGGGDFAALETLMKECLTHYSGSPEGGTAATRALLAPASGSAEAVIALVDGKPAGFASFALVYPGPEGRGTLFMKDLFVSAAVRSRAVGSALVRYLAQLATELDCARLDWTAERSNGRALAFYDRIGAARIEEKIFYRLEGAALAAMAAPEEAPGQ
ncbi:GNAT family N-acetyltransferase [Radicibacter daui]|uniref:GNAT family N-acetyltransferase n=1 Tax=Radicibacter daui TaxID=3064829 RepID=UPI0040468EE6